MSPPDLLALVCCDLGAIVRGRSLPASTPDEGLPAGVGWVPANSALTPLGDLAEPNPFGSTGDLRLLPDRATHVRVEGEGDAGALEFVLCDIAHTDGRPWECCPRRFLREALAELESELGARLWASFEHEFQLLSEFAPAAPFSLEAQRLAEPFAARVMHALEQGGARPERFIAEFADHQYEIPVHAAEGLQSADRSVVVKEIVRELARREGVRATFTPLLDPTGPGNGTHIHLSLLDREGRPLLYDAGRPGCLSELAGSFAAGILDHADALTALCAANPTSAARLAPHHWSAGAVCLAPRNREALLRIPPLVELSGDPASQMRLEYRGADASANPYLALGAIVRAGVEGVRRGLPTPALLESDPATLEPADAARFRVGGQPQSLAQSLEALAADASVRSWMGGLLYEAYLSLKRAELEDTSEEDLAQTCRRYAGIY